MVDRPLKELLREQKNAQFEYKAPTEEKKFERKSKHAPKEMSTKRPVSRFKKIVFPKLGDDPEKGIFTKKSKPRDPRFDNLSGKFNKNFFDINYKFVDEIRNMEVEELKQALAENKYPDQAEQIQKVLNKKLQEINRVTDERRYSSVKSNLLKQEREKVKQGKQPYFHTKAEIKRLAKEQKIQELKSEGNLGKYLSNKKKKQKRKEFEKEPKIVKRRKLSE